MKIELKPIKTEKDYKSFKNKLIYYGTLNQILKIMINDILITLVEVYEEKNYPIDIPDQ